jgi:hypothetical protein
MCVKSESNLMKTRPMQIKLLNINTQNSKIRIFADLEIGDTLKISGEKLT